MAQWLGAMAALPEDLALDPSIHMAAPGYLTPRLASVETGPL